jgi:hypothetical protein
MDVSVAIKLESSFCVLGAFTMCRAPGMIKDEGEWTYGSGILGTTALPICKLVRAASTRPPASCIDFTGPSYAIFAMDAIYLYKISGSVHSMGETLMIQYLFACRWTRSALSQRKSSNITKD